MANQINTVSLNIRGLNDEKKRMKIFKWLETNNSKIVMLQETFCTKDFPKSNHPNWIIMHNFTNSTHSRGVAIMFHNSLQMEIQNIH